MSNHGMFKLKMPPAVGGPYGPHPPRYYEKQLPVNVKIEKKGAEHQRMIDFA